MSFESWHCPNCLRTVPGRVRTCYCGVQRSQVTDEPRPAATGARAYGGLVAILAAAVGGGLLVTSFQRPEASAPEPASNPAPVTVSSQPAARPTSTTLPSTISEASPQPTPVPAFLRARSARIEPTPDPRVANAESETEEEGDSVAAMREEGTGRLEEALAALRPKILALQSKVRTYGDGCASSRATLARGGCPTIKEDILRLRAEIERTVSESDDAARRSWVTPGARRELLREHGLDAASWDQIVASTERVLTGQR